MVSNNESESGSRAFIGFRREINKKVEEWTNKAASLTKGSESPTRFGNEQIHKYELVKTMAEAMSRPPLGEGGYLQLLMKNEHWIGWFRLSTKSDTRSSWFHNTLTTDPDEFNKCCQLIMRKIFTMFESACHNLTSSPERAYLDFLLGKDFERLYKEEFPECLRDNRHCAIYLVDSLKTIFEAWFADAVIDLKKQNLQLEGKASDEDQIVDVSSNECIMMTQNVVGCWLNLFEDALQ